MRRRSQGRTLLRASFSRPLIAGVLSLARLSRRKAQSIPGELSSSRDYLSARFLVLFSVDHSLMEAWYMDDSDEDQRLPHHLNPPQYVSHEMLAKLGVLNWVLNADNFENDPELETIRAKRGYNYQDIITISPEKLPNYEEKIRSFFEEHIHLDEEIRYCLEGSGYFDVRDAQDRWIRIWVKKGDMIVLPAGSYHRFTLDANNFIKAMRLFVGEPIWTPYNRPQDDNQIRKEYVTHFLRTQPDAVAVQ